MDLSQKHCVPCEGSATPFSENRAREFLKETTGETQGWELHEVAPSPFKDRMKHLQIEKEWKMRNFRDAVAFVNRVADIAEKQGHHPDILLHGWNKVRLTLSTHAIGGLSENDFIMAAALNRAAP